MLGWLCHRLLNSSTFTYVRRASRRYTAYAHPAGSGFDFLSAVNLKGEWERELGVTISGPEDHLYDAGSHDSQARIRDGMGKMGVWIDTVSSELYQVLAIIHMFYELCFVARNTLRELNDC